MIAAGRLGVVRLLFISVALALTYGEVHIAETHSLNSRKNGEIKESRITKTVEETDADQMQQQTNELEISSDSDEETEVAETESTNGEDYTSWIQHGCNWPRGRPCRQNRWRPVGVPAINPLNHLLNTNHNTNTNINRNENVNTNVNHNINDNINDNFNPNGGGGCAFC